MNTASQQSRFRRMFQWIGGANLVAAFCLVPIWHCSRNLDRDISHLETQLETQRLLHPILKDLAKEAASSRRIAAVTRPLPAPGDLTGVIERMHQLATLSGINNATFLPASETIMRQENQIRLDGQINGSLDSFRRFLLLASDQEWITRLDSITINAAAGAPISALSLWVKLKRT